MCDDLLDFKVGMFFSRVIIKKGFELVYKVVLFVWDLHVGHNDIVWCVSPVILSNIVDSVCFTREIETLLDVLTVLLDQRTPLD